MRGVLPVAVLLLAVGAAVAIAPDRSEVSSPDGDVARTASDPVVRDVVRMLGAGVEDSVVQDWLERTGARPGTLSPEDLIALARAGASESLKRRILALAPSASAPPPSPEGVPTGSPAGAVPPTPETRGAEEPPEPSSGPVTLEVSIDYWSPSDETEPAWDLYVYLDGRPIARVRPKSTPFDRAVRVGIEIEPGPRTVRILRERHTLRSKAKGLWHHEAAVLDEAIAFAASAGSWKLTLDVNASGGWPWRKRGPLTWKLTRDGEVREERSRVGARLADWPALCEELETAIGTSGKPPRWMERERSRCVRWPSLWPDPASVPPRADVRAALERRGFRPEP